MEQNRPGLKSQRCHLQRCGTLGSLHKLVRVKLLGSSAGTAGGDVCDVSCPAPGAEHCSGTAEGPGQAVEARLLSGLRLHDPRLNFFSHSVRGQRHSPACQRRIQDSDEALGSWSEKVQVLNAVPALTGRAQSCGRLQNLSASTASSVECGPDRLCLTECSWGSNQILRPGMQEASSAKTWAGRHCLCFRESPCGQQSWATVRARLAGVRKNPSFRRQNQ